MKSIDYAPSCFRDGAAAELHKSCTIGSFPRLGPPTASTHLILGGRDYVYRRENSRLWQCSTCLAGKTRRISTKEEGLDRAGEFAQDWLLELRGKARAGEISAEKTFRVPPRQFERECKIITGDPD